MKTDFPTSLPALRLDRLDNPRRVGRQWCCTCPVCGTRHLYVNPVTGLFKCFYAGCPYKGIAEEKKTFRPSSPRSYAQRGKQSSPFTGRYSPLQKPKASSARHWTDEGCDFLCGYEEE